MLYGMDSVKIKSPQIIICGLFDKAESKRFELLIQFPIYTLSRRAPSATRTTLQTFQVGKNTVSNLISRIFFQHWL